MTRGIPLVGAATVVGIPVAIGLVAALAIATFDRTNRTISSGGAEREYLVHVPPSVGRASAAPLVISLHENAMWPAAQRQRARWDDVAEREGFVVAYPSALRGSRSRAWAMDDDEVVRENAGFIVELVEALRQELGIDPARVYLSGSGGGGAMALAVHCLLPGRFAAVATVASTQALPWRFCREVQPLSLLAFNGTDDRLIPMGSDETLAGRPVPYPYAAWVRHWARRSRCGREPVVSPRTRQVTRMEYPHCVAGISVVMNAMHLWRADGRPRFLGGSYSAPADGIDPAREMWEFFSERSRGERQGPVTRNGRSSRGEERPDRTTQ